jgi:ADP-ribose pyrophosphatase
MKEFAPITPWQVLSERTLVDRRWLEVREQRVRLANGHEIESFHLLKGPNWAGVLCLTEQREIALVRQYRHGLGGPSLELPAGVIDPGEDPLAAAKREIARRNRAAGGAFRAARLVLARARAQLHARLFLFR